MPDLLLPWRGRGIPSSLQGELPMATISTGYAKRSTRGYIPMPLQGIKTNHLHPLFHRRNAFYNAFRGVVDLRFRQHRGQAKPDCGA